MSARIVLTVLLSCLMLASQGSPGFTAPSNSQAGPLECDDPSREKECAKQIAGQILANVHGVTNRGYGLGGAVIPKATLPAVRSALEVAGLTYVSGGGERSTKTCSDDACIVVRGWSTYVEQWETQSWLVGPHSRVCPTAYFYAAEYGDDPVVWDIVDDPLDEYCYALAADEAAVWYAVTGDVPMVFEDNTLIWNQWRPDPPLGDSPLVWLRD